MKKKLFSIKIRNKNIKKYFENKNKILYNEVRKYKGALMIWKEIN